MIYQYLSQSEKETEKIAFQLTKKLKGGEVIGLTGQLGAGKTVFVKGLANSLGIKKAITSPSFILMKVYQIKNCKLKIKTFIHIDVYRLKSVQDLIEIGVFDWLGKKETVAVIEWADRVKKILPKKTIQIKINLGKKENERMIKIKIPNHYGTNLQSKKIRK
ncbi:MAG: tRNA (adenosine(37)-N6)-threonylcarbamoyltransferase complex ATPase subunit type 1 TsaE [Patescibacteria group bacterium]|nr:tRNA (adenosine(37)-N6)-threonylcarbamoyltransferase complex ATPase subunit type 1 TsaE [Patescibacteria group bacterium]